MARPTKYKKEYCELLIEHMDTGGSFESFAADLNVCRQTLYDWTEAHPEFLDTKKRAEAKALRYFERLGDDMMKGLIEKGNSTVWIFNMKNRFKWTDRHEITKDVKDMDEDEFNALAAKVVDRIKANKE
jgi:hypothetical protein